MTFRPAVRKGVLAAHVVASVGWLGAIAAFLPVAVVGAAGRDPHSVMSAYLAMDWIAAQHSPPSCGCTRELDRALSSARASWPSPRHVPAARSLASTMAAPPPVVVFRSIYRGRTIYAISAWLLEETDRYVVLATVPGADCLVLVGDRLQILRDVAAGTERVERRAWEHNRVLWIVPFDTPYMVGMFWRAASDEFIGYYINLQAVVERDATGFNSLDHILDVVVMPDLEWRWKDVDELEVAVDVGLYSPDEAADIRANGERAVAELPRLVPTGWEDWRPDPAWPVPQLNP